MLTELRTDVADKLTAGGVRAVEYVGETITPPCAAVVPHQPYLQWRGRTDAVPFGHIVASIDVLLVSSREASKKAASTIDSLIEDAVKALDDYDITQVSQPGVINLSGAKFIGAVLTIESTTREP